MKRWVVSLAAGLAFVAAACGSTVQMRSTATPSASGESGLDGAGTYADGASGDGGAGEVGGDGVESPAAAGRSGRATSGGPRNSTIPTGAGGSTGKVTGVTSTEIRIGYGTQKDADQAAVAYGLQAVFGDQEGQARAIADDINRHGGVLGRKLVLVFHDDKTANDTANPDATATAQCADWTQDHPVFAGINIVANRNRPSFFGCMANAHTPVLYSDLDSHSRADLQKFAPYLYAPGVATLERYVPTWIERLSARGYFTGWNTASGSAGNAPVKVGVPYTDNDIGRRYFAAVKSALAAAGRRVDDSFAFAADDGTALSQIPQVILRFRRNGITHVLLPQSAYLVTPVAEQQGYRPRYGLTTLDGLASVTTTTSPEAQLNGALGVGWFPASDVDASHSPGPVSANETRCRKVMADAGFATTDPLTLTVQLINCDLFLMLSDALNRAGTISATALQRGAAALGNGFPPVFTFVERYGPGRYDGAAAARDIAYDNGCNCFTFLDATNRAFPD
jgi:ABC-type branched-subunit amino acid transport system substrate-binding protein